MSKVVVIRSCVTMNYFFQILSRRNVYIISTWDLGVKVFVNRYENQGYSLRVQTFVMTGDHFWFVRWCWGVISLVFELLNITSNIRRETEPLSSLRKHCVKRKMKKTTPHIIFIDDYISIVNNIRKNKQYVPLEQMAIVIFMPVVS